MYDNIKIIEGLQNVVGFKNHYDLTEVPALDSDLLISESGEFFNDKHPAMRLDIIKSIIPANRDLNDFLREKREVAITELIGEICSQKKYEEYARKTLVNDILIDKYGWVNNTIINQGRFVGFKIRNKQSIGLVSIIKKIGLQLTLAQDLTIYVYHSSKIDPVQTITVNATKGIQWNWSEQEIKLNAETKEITGGIWIIGYYQNDLIGQAISYNELNWISGPCSTCDGGVGIDKFRKVQKYVDIKPFYVPNVSLNGTDMFDLEDTIEVYDTNFGMNFGLTVECDLTDFFIEHRFSLKKALSLRFTYLILKEIMFSLNIHYIEEALKSLIIRDLEGDKETNYVNIADQLANEIKAVNFDHSKISEACLPCNSKRGVSYGVI